MLKCVPTATILYITTFLTIEIPCTNLAVTQQPTMPTNNLKYVSTSIINEDDKTTVKTLKKCESNA